MIPTTAGATDRTLYDARVLGGVPDGVPDGDRSYIEGIAYDGVDVYSGTASGSTGSGVPVSTFGVPSKISSWNRVTGEPHSPIVVTGKDLTREHALGGMMMNDDESILALSLQHGLLRFSRDGDGWRLDSTAGFAGLKANAPEGSPKGGQQ